MLGLYTHMYVRNIKYSSEIQKDIECYLMSRKMWKDLLYMLVIKGIVDTNMNRETHGWVEWKSFGWWPGFVHLWVYIGCDG